MRLRGLILFALATACGPDQQPLECNGGSDFEVVISAKEGPLPADTVLKLYYGGRAPSDPEVLTLADPQTPQALFCHVSDKSGAYDKSEPALGAKPSAATESSAGAGGEAGAGDGQIEALNCGLWTDGSANLEVVNQMYGTSSLMLALKKGVCTVHTTLVLEPMDGGT